MFKKYIIIGLSLLSLVNAQLKAMEAQTTAIQETAAIQKAKPLIVNDCHGNPCQISPLLLKHSKTLRDFVQEPKEIVDVDQKNDTKTISVDVETLNLLTQALHHIQYPPFWEKLTAEQLHAMHQAEDYLEVPILCKQITKWLLQKDPGAKKPYVSLFVPNRYFEPTLANHTLHTIPSVKSLVKKEPIVCDSEAQRIDLSNKELTSLKGLEKIPASVRKKCEVLDLSGNNLGTLNIDIIWDHLPNLTVLIAEKAQITHVKGTRTLPDGVILLFAHNKISQFDTELIKGSQRCFIDLSNNELSEELLQNLQNQIGQISLKEKIRRKMGNLMVNNWNGRLNIPATMTVAIIASLSIAGAADRYKFYLAKILPLIPCLPCAEKIITRNISDWGKWASFGIIDLALNGNKIISFDKETGTLTFIESTAKMTNPYFAIPLVLGTGIICTASLGGFFFLVNNLPAWLNQPFIAAYIKNSDQLPNATLTKKHILCAAAKMKQAVDAHKSDRGLEILL